MEYWNDGLRPGENHENKSGNNLFQLLETFSKPLPRYSHWGEVPKFLSIIFMLGGEYDKNKKT
jgi:hypothetical protein